MNLPRRRAARVVLLDAEGRVLLFRLVGSRDPDGRGSWYLPGGGIRPFEAVEAAARRELREETGIRDITLGPVVGERRGVRFMLRGRAVVQDEWYVAAWLGSMTPNLAGGRDGDDELDRAEAHRWWSAADLAAGREVVLPPGLAELVEAAARAGSPPGRQG